MNMGGLCAREVVAGPLARSSYHAAEMLRAA